MKTYTVVAYTPSPDGHLIRLEYPLREGAPYVNATLVAAMLPAHWLPHIECNEFASDPSLRRDFKIVAVPRREALCDEYANFRVVNLKTGEESQLYSLEQCKSIVDMAARGELRGSFDVNARHPMTAAALDEFTKHYLHAALFTEELDGQYDLKDFTPEALRRAYDDCLRFRLAERDNLAVAYEEYTEKGLVNHPDAGSPDACAGHDFWLSRNGHGTGFWDRGLSVGDELHQAASACGMVSLSVQDGQIHMG